MNPACTARGIRSCRARCASWIVLARLASWSSLRRSRGRFRRKSRAMVASPERASSISAEHTAAASARLRSAKMERKTLSATRSSLSCLRALALRGLRDGQPPELGGENAQPATVAAPPLRGPIEAARDAERRRGPEDPLDDPALHAHDRAVGQERVDEHPVAADRVDAEDQRQLWPALAPDERQPARLGLRDGAFAPAPAAAERAASRLRLRARAPVAPDALEVAARRRVALDLRERRLEGLDLGLHLTDAPEVLVLAERRLDPPPEGLGRRAGAEEQRGGAVAELELALDRLGRAVHDAQEILHAVARVEGDDAPALGVDPAPAGAPRHLRQLVVRERAEPVVRALGEPLEHDAARGHVDAERHRLRRKDHSTDAALEELLDEPLEARQDPGVVETDAEPERLEDRLVQGGLGDGRALLDERVDRVVHVVLLR